MESINAAGIVPLQKRKILLVFSHRRFWGFPKGHQETGETLYQTACRELQEETGLRVRKSLLEEAFVDIYPVSTKQKRVSYFVAEVEGVLIPQASEILEAAWFTPAEVLKTLSYPPPPLLLRYLNNLDHTSKN